MKTKKIIPYAIFVLVVLGLGIYGYPQIKSRYFAPTEQAESEQNPKDMASLQNQQENLQTENQNAENGDENSDSQDQESSLDDDTSDISEEEYLDDSGDDASTDDNSFLPVEKQDCDKKCTSFEDQEDIDYCKQVCGLAETKKTSSCDSLEDDSLEKDYCLKDLGISKKDKEICDEIQDENLKKTCINRILEDITDEINQSAAGKLE